MGYLDYLLLFGENSHLIWLFHIYFGYPSGYN